MFILTGSLYFKVLLSLNLKISSHLTVISVRARALSMRASVWNRVCIDVTLPRIHDVSTPERALPSWVAKHSAR